MTTQKSNELNEIAVIRKLSIVSILGNFVLSVFKAFAGFFGQSGAMISDAVHSFSDVLTTIIAFIGVKLSKKQADKSHPYGHERIECVAALFLGLLLLVTGLGVGKVGLENILSGDYAKLAVPKLIALIAAIISIIVKEAMFWYTRYHAKQINSAAFMADAWHHRSDALSSIGSLIGIAGAMLGFPVLDSVASVIICLFILKVSYDILKDAIKKMMDTSCDEAFEKELREYIEGLEDEFTVDMLQTRMFGNKIYVDLEIQVDGDKTLREGHDIAESVHNSVENKYPDIKHIMIHVNPTQE
ncbi:MAG: cation diffusion facilitator family transporter [Ruminococcus sp.]|nr:cation diffusion facilitator family transporter [Ruminococcus sp.]